MKTFQTRKNYVPYLSEETKALMQERNVLKQEATKTNDPVLMAEFRKIRNEVKKRVTSDEENYYKSAFLKEDSDIRSCWKNVYSILGTSKNLSPSKINFNGRIVSNPTELAEAFSEIFSNKLKNIRNKVCKETKKRAMSTPKLMITVVNTRRYP